MKASKEEILKQIKFVLELDEKTRGSYLFQSIWIETLLNQIIANYFFPDDFKKQGSFTGLILADLTFNHKIKYFLKILDSVPNMKSKYPKIKKTLDNVRNLRNKYAHSQLDTSMDFISKKTDYIRLRYYKEGELLHYNITENLIKEKNSEIAKLHLTLNDILRSISGGKLGILEPVGSLDSQE